MFDKQKGTKKTDKFRKEKEEENKDSFKVIEKSLSELDGMKKEDILIGLTAIFTAPGKEDKGLQIGEIVEAKEVDGEIMLKIKSRDDIKYEVKNSDVQLV